MLKVLCYDELSWGSGNHHTTHDPSRVAENQVTKELTGHVFGDNARTINNLFTYMEIADEVITDAQHTYPEKKRKSLTVSDFLSPVCFYSFQNTII